MTIITRKVYEPGGFAYSFLDGKCNPLPPNVSHLYRNEIGELIEVTWDEVMVQRREQQRERLERIREPREPGICPCYVWTFFNAHDIPYHGWYCYVVTRHFDIAVNFRGFKDELASSIMKAIPLDGLFPMAENFYPWMEAFAKAHPRRRHREDPRQAGSLVGWLTGRRCFTLERPV